jgi:hypothetical protein
MTAALIILAVLNPLSATVCVGLGVWAAKHGILTIRRPPRPPAPKEPQP